MTTNRTAQHIKRTLGLRTAAGYLRNRGVPLAIALYWLTGSAREAFTTTKGA